MSGMDEITEDLAAEQAALESVVSGLDAEGWSTPTAAAGWDVRETIVHVAFYDDTARLAIVDPAGFAALLDRAVRGGFDVPAAHAHLSGPEVFAWWREARAGLLAALAPARPEGPHPVVRSAHERPLLRHRPADGDLEPRLGRGGGAGPARPADGPPAPRGPPRRRHPRVVVRGPGTAGAG